MKNESAEVVPEKFKTLWQKCLPYLERGRPGDVEHSLETVRLVLQYKDILSLDEDVLVPVGMMHDDDQLEGVDLNAAYDSENKKIFHDPDSLDRYNSRRINSMKSIYKDQAVLSKILEDSLKNFFLEEFRKIAEDNLKNLKDNAG